MIVGSKRPILLPMEKPTAMDTMMTGLPVLTIGTMVGMIAMRPTGMATMMSGMKMTELHRCNLRWTRRQLWMEFPKIYEASTMKLLPYSRRRARP